MASNKETPARAASGKAPATKAKLAGSAPGKSPARPAPVKVSRKSKPAAASQPNEAPIATASDLVDEQLAKYRGMRNFAVTAEPSGAGSEAVRQAAARTSPARAKSAGGLPFVIQKHAASHLHYDFRLGWSGVLKSWAVAKGPSYVVGDRRLAVQVEDHPMEYGGFEGVIPKGQYGGGTVMVWDEGTWWPQPGHENVDAGLREGSLKIEMHGTKMRGKWALIRMHTTKAAPGGRWKSSDKPQWLLLKEHDEFERSKEAPCITDEAPNSATTGRTMEEIARQGDHVWNSKETAGPGQPWFRQEAAASEQIPPATRQTQAGVNKLTVAPRRPMKPAAAPNLPPAVSEALETLPRETQPEFLPPELAQETEAPPEGTGWLHELKLDGYRMQARKSGRGVQMLTRSGLDWTYRVQAVADAVAQLPVSSVTLDGEVVVLAEDGNTNFAQLQASFQSGEKHPLTFFCFDLLHLEGRNPRDLPLRERKDLLAAILPSGDNSPVRLSEHLETGGGAMFEGACKLHAEGIISKLADAPYRAGRNGNWLKAKCLHEQEFVVGGFTLSSDGPDRVGSLLIGYYRAGKLVYAGRTGTGFTQKLRRELRTRVSALETKTVPFVKVPTDARRGALWVRPELVAQVRFATWTAEDLVRQAAFLGLREDKRPQEVFREEPTVAPQPKGSGHARPGPEPASKRASASQRPSAPIAARVLTPVAGGAVTPPSPPAKGLASLPVPVRLTHPTKVLDPESGLTKRELAEYYWAVAERMLPHIADRPLSLVRCPDGAGKPCF